MSEYKCMFCSEGDTLENLINQIEKMAQIKGVSKSDIIKLSLIYEIRKMRIAIENRNLPKPVKNIYRN